MINLIKKITSKVTLQHVFLVCTLLIICLPILASAANDPYWEMPQWEKSAWDGKGGIVNQDAATAFYQRYHVYLTPLWGILAPLVSVGGRLVQFIVSLPGIFQDIFFGSVKLLGIYTQLEDQNTELGKLFISMQMLGAIVFGLTSIIYFTYVIFNGNSKKVKKVMESAVLLFLFIGFIPWGLNKVFAMSSSAIADTSKATTTDIGKTLIQNNVVDKEMLTLKNWDVKLDSSGVIENPAQYNQIKSVYGWDPGEVLGVINVDLLEKLDEEKKKIEPSDQDYFQNIFKSQLVTFPAVSGVSGQEFREKFEVGGISHHKTLTAANYMESNYLRYKVNWLPLIISAFAISFIYIMMTLKVGTSAFITVMTTIAAPVLAAIKSNSPKKIKEELGHILSGAYSVFFEFLIVVVAMYMMLWINSSAATEIIAATGLSGLQSAFLKCFFYIGLFYGVMSGVQAIERFIGISTSHQNPLQQIASTMIVAGGLTKAGGAMLDTVKSGGGNMLGRLVEVAQGQKSDGKNNDNYGHYFGSSRNKNEENPYHSNGNNKEQSYTQGFNDDRFNANKESQESGRQKETSEGQTNFSQTPLEDDAFTGYHQENEATPGYSEPSQHTSGESESEQPHVKSRKEKAIESLNRKRGIVPPDRSSNQRGDNSAFEQRERYYSEPNLNQEHKNDDKRGHKHIHKDSGKDTYNHSGQKRTVSPQPTSSGSLNDRIQNLEEQSQQKHRNEQRSVRAQQAAQRLQKRQMAGQQVQTGIQRMQGASQNHFVNPVEEED